MSKDLIDRGALRVGRCNSDIIDPAYAAGWNGLLNIINSAPTVQPEAMRGKWIKETERTGNYSHCSQCGCRCAGYTPNYKYCPNCGAKMDLEVDHEAG